MFGFGVVVFWNFKGEETEKKWIEQHILPHKQVLGLKHNAECIESACDEMGFCYGDAFRWRRDVVELHTRDAGEKLAVSFAVAKSSNLSIYEVSLARNIQQVVVHSVLSNGYRSAILEQYSVENEPGHRKECTHS